MAIQSICVHGHFYQPPREDPITGEIPQEAGAEPYHNWNERILAECYRPNAELGNFRLISFNVGPTLWEWIESYDPAVCRKIVSQDHANLGRFGVGNAMAQAYNHTILPLATYNDKVTQIYWGIADFQHRFGHNPQGMWLPETAVDLETLNILAEQGIDFTILAPWQAVQENIDSSEPYLVQLDQGRRINVFFYNRELSTKVSFDQGATTNADSFIQKEVSPRFQAEKTKNNEPQLLLIASDGELYGHHQKFRDQFLAHLVNGASVEAGFSSSYPGLWLKSYPVVKTIRIREKTSWSCPHGVMRWMGQCECINTDGRWKYYLRKAFDHLSEEIDHIYFDSLSPYIQDPWALRNQYIYVVLGKMSTVDLINDMAGHKLPAQAIHSIQQLLEAQFERQRMYTSCGWFYEDFNRIETKNNLAYAAQAVRLIRLATGVDLTPNVIADLKHVISHRTGLRGDVVFQRLLRGTIK